MGDYIFYKGRYRGHSVNDTKPSPVGKYLKRLQETDTGIIYYSDGAAWINPQDTFHRQQWGKMRDIYSPIRGGRKWGSLIGTSVSPLINLGTSILAASGQASPVVTRDNTKGWFVTYNTGTTTGNNGGGHASNLFSRAMNPYWSMRGRLVSTTNLRSFFGLSSDAANSPSASDTYATSKHVAMIGSRSNDTNFQFIHNDGSNPALYEDTGIPVNNTVRTWEIFGDDNGARFGWAVDGGTINWVTTQPPGSTNALGIVHEVQTNESGVAKSFDMLSMYIEFDTK
jgi:hypothetical protein